MAVVLVDPSRLHSLLGEVQWKSTSGQKNSNLFSSWEPLCCFFGVSPGQKSLPAQDWPGLVFESHFGPVPQDATESLHPERCECQPKGASWGPFCRDPDLRIQEGRGLGSA